VLWIGDNSAMGTAMLASVSVGRVREFHLRGGLKGKIRNSVKTIGRDYTVYKEVHGRLSLNSRKWAHNLQNALDIWESRAKWVRRKGEYNVELVKRAVFLVWFSQMCV